MKKVKLIFPLFFFCLSGAFSQTRLFSPPRDSLKFNNRKYKQEIGLGIEGILKGNLGSALVYKVRDDRAKLVPVTYSDFWRFQAGISGNATGGIKDTSLVGGYQIVYKEPASDYHNIYVLIGRERNNFNNRFNLYYGWELGPVMGHNTDPYFQAQLSQGLYLQGFESWRFGLTGDVFAGIKYHITNRISISAEAAFFLSYLLQRQRNIIVSGIDTITADWKNRNIFSYSLRYLRFITLNYHFKEY